MAKITITLQPQEIYFLKRLIETTAMKDIEDIANEIFGDANPVFDLHETLLDSIYHC